MPLAEYKGKEINALSVLPGDVGSALLTMARLRCDGGEQQVNMYVMENFPEVNLSTLNP